MNRWMDRRMDKYGFPLTCLFEALCAKNASRMKLPCPDSEENSELT
jgi:hypothetical protein